MRRVKYERKTKTAPIRAPVKVDWSGTLWALTNKGYRMPSIGRMIGTGRDAVRGFRDRGSEPTYSQGVLILQLAKEEGIYDES